MDPEKIKNYVALGQLWVVRILLGFCVLFTAFVLGGRGYKEISPKIIRPTAGFTPASVGTAPSPTSTPVITYSLPVVSPLVFSEVTIYDPVALKRKSTDDFQDFQTMYYQRIECTDGKSDVEVKFEVGDSVYFLEEFDTSSKVVLSSNTSLYVSCNPSRDETLYYAIVSQNPTP